MNDSATRLVWAATKTLRPMVKRLLEMGVPYGALETSLRELFVRVAESELPAHPDRPPTDSSISVVTGINRKEVKRIRAATARNEQPRSFGINQAAALISRWMSDPQTTDKRGRPLPLPYKRARGPSFMRLARRVTGDLAPGVLLKELVRNGAVELRKNDMVLLRGDAYVPRATDSDLQILAEDPPELIETILRNTFSEGGERLLQRKVYYDNLGSDAAVRIRAKMRREGQRFIRRIDRLLAGFDRDRNPRAPGGDRYYASVGAYFFEDLLSAERPSPPGAIRSGRRPRRHPK